MAADFDWDPAKDAENLRKHGVSFGEAQIAFLDPGRVIARDTQPGRAALLLLWSRIGGCPDGPVYLSGQRHSDNRRRFLAQRQETL